MKADFDYCSSSRFEEFIERGLDSIEKNRLSKNKWEKTNLGFVYLIDFGDGKTKIGITRGNPRQRMRQLTGSDKTIMPYELRLIAVGLCNQAESVEKILHTEYGNFRCAGEWFDFSSNDALGAKVDLIVDLHRFSQSFCFCDGWPKWKPNDEYIAEYSKCNPQADLPSIIDWEKTKNDPEAMKIVEAWLNKINELEAVCTV